MLAEYAIIPFAALGASILTFLSGFGLGTIMMPVFALFFPVPVAIALAAVVHFLNNFFEMAFLHRAVNVKVALSFGIPAAVAAYGGARLLHLLAGIHRIASYELLGIRAEVTVVKLVVALLILVFAIFEVIPRLKEIAFDRRYVPLGGLISGFFGGLSGHQGAPRAAFLIRIGLTKESFIATGIAAGILIDLSRLSVYLRHLDMIGPVASLPILALTCVAALVGTVIGSRLLKKLTFPTVRVVVMLLLAIVAVGMAGGLF